MINFVSKSTPLQVEFSELDPTAIFIEPNSTKNFYFMKLSENTFVNLSNGYYGSWNPDDLVIPVDVDCPSDIFVNNTADRTRFSDIGYGETFAIDNMAFQSYYMKINTNIPDYNTVNLINGKLCFFDSCQPIQIAAIFYEVSLSYAHNIRKNGIYKNNRFL